jgi:hypothetical protein
VGLHEAKLDSFTSQENGTVRWHVKSHPLIACAHRQFAIDEIDSLNEPFHL